MNLQLNYQIAKDRQAEFQRNAVENRHFDQRMTHGTRRAISFVLALLDGPNRYLRAAFRAASAARDINPPDLRMGSSG